MAASMTSGPIPSPAITAMSEVFTVQPSNRPALFKARRSPACQAVRPPHIQLTAAALALQLARPLWLATVRTEANLAIAGKHAAAVLALIGGRCVVAARHPKRRRWDIGQRYRILARCVTQLLVSVVRA